MRAPWGSLPAGVYAEVVTRVMRLKGGRVYFIGVGGLVISWRRDAEQAPTR